MGGIVVLASWEYIFIRVHKNLMQHPSNNILIVCELVRAIIAPPHLISRIMESKRNSWFRLIFIVAYLLFLAPEGPIS